MRRFRDIVEDIKAPSPQSLWLNKGTAKVFVNGKWVTTGEESPDQKELEDKVDNLDKEVDRLIL